MITILFYVKNVDEFANQAVAAGATLIKPLEDPFGHLWSIATKKKKYLEKKW